MDASKIMKSPSKCRCFGWHLVSVIFIAFGFSLVIFFPNFFNKQLLKNLELHMESRSFSEWKKPTALLYMDVYLYNWTNPDEIKSVSSKPRYTQLGPYRFRMSPEKLNISFDATNSTVSYRKFSTYFFDPEGSNGSLSDLCTTVNMVAIGAGSTAKEWGYLKQFSVSVSLGIYNQKLHVTKTVAELLFEGYEDDLVKMGKVFDNKTPFDRVGLLVKMNGTDLLSGNYTANTGVDDIYALGKIEKYNNLTEFPYYEGECKKLKGSAGEFFSPEPSKKDPIYLFTPDMCRAIPYDYEMDIKVRGLLGHRFSAGVRALDNGTFDIENKCFGTNELMPSGVMNVSICNYDHPIFMSFPHFYGADASYLNAVDGLSPIKEKHQSYFTLEPKTGITLEVTARFQTNVLMKQYGDQISLFQNVPRIFLPVFWVETKFVLDAEKAGQLRFALYAPVIGQIVGVSLLIVGFAILSIRYIRRLFFANQQSSTLIPMNDKHTKSAVKKDCEMKPLQSQFND